MDFQAGGAEAAGYNDEFIAPFVSEFAGEKDVSDVIHMFIASLPNSVAALRRQLSEGDHRGLCRALHSLSGAAAVCGFRAVAAALALANSSYRGNHPHAKRYFERAIATIRNVLGYSVTAEHEHAKALIPAAAAGEEVTA